MRFRVLAVLVVALTYFSSMAGQCSESQPWWPVEVGLIAPASDRLAAAEMWLRAAREQGVPTSIVTVDDVRSDWRNSRQRFAALVLPDALVRTVPPSFVDELRAYVESGGRLMVVFDAGILDDDGKYAPSHSRLSDLVGVNYALHDRLGDEMFRSGPVFASPASAKKLGVPPGVAIQDIQPRAHSPFTLRLHTYGYPQMILSSFVTEGHYDGEPLLVGPGGQIVAGIRRVKKGLVIFANLPLGDLKLNGTDGWPLHRFLRLLALECRLPVLAMTPGGVGGMVLNIHVDDGGAVAPLKKMQSSGFFNHGPFSVHVTAGPDVETEGDGLGIDVPHNRAFQDMLQVLASGGHEIGSHGGWIHNYWSSNANAESAARDEHLLELNARALADAIREPIRVYSAPGGQHPQWATDWLRRHGFVAYYTTANNAAAPTRGYRDGALADIGIWSFPIVTHGQIATFEEAAEANWDEHDDVIPWLKALARFTADQHEVRMFYFHPPGVSLYEHALTALISQAQALHRRFRWYTMASLSRFLDRRETAQWSVERRDNRARVTAESPDSLKDLTWLIPTGRYARPSIVEGEATIGRDGSDWMVAATEGGRLVIDLTPLANQRMGNSVGRTGGQAQTPERSWQKVRLSGVNIGEGRHASEPPERLPGEVLAAYHQAR
jgi:peptidoglycan/xylan/chitin deacetylase (PgdA/CDA1 family)